MREFAGKTCKVELNQQYHSLKAGVECQVPYSLHTLLLMGVGELPCGPGTAVGLKGANTALPTPVSLTPGLGTRYRCRSMAKLPLQVMHSH